MRLDRHRCDSPLRFLSRAVMLRWPPGTRPRAGSRGLAPARFRRHDRSAMTLHVNLPNSLAAPARTLAGREHITGDGLIASALSVPLDHTPHRPTIAERAARVDGQKVDAILVRVPAVPPAAGDEG